MAPGSSINWANINESNAPQSEAYKHAESAYTYAGSAYQYAADNAFTDEKLFNSLTNDGTRFGVFSAENGKLFINASYINSGTINADLIQTGVLNADLIGANNGIYIEFNDAISSYYASFPQISLGESIEICRGSKASDSYISNNSPDSLCLYGSDGCIFMYSHPYVYTYSSSAGAYGLYEVISAANIDQYISNAAVFG